MEKNYNVERWKEPQKSCKKCWEAEEIMPLLMNTTDQKLEAVALVFSVIFGTRKKK